MNQNATERPDWSAWRLLQMSVCNHWRIPAVRAMLLRAFLFLVQIWSITWSAFGQPIVWQPYPTETTGGEYGFGDMNPSFFLSPAKQGKLIGVQDRRSSYLQRRTTFWDRESSALGRPLSLWHSWGIGLWEHAGAAKKESAMTVASDSSHRPRYGVKLKSNATFPGAGTQQLEPALMPASPKSLQASGGETAMNLTIRNLKPAITGFAACAVLLTSVVASGQHFEADKKAHVKGTIQSRKGDLVTIRDKKNGDLAVIDLTDNTKFERTSDFRLRHKDMDITAMVPGLSIDVEGVGNGEGQLEAKKITFDPNVFNIEVAEEKQIEANQASAARAQGTANQGVAAAGQAQASANQAQASADQAGQAATLVGVMA